MILIIQAIVILTALGVIMFILVGRETHAARAWKKIALCILAITMILAVLFPELTNWAAHVVGVGRGADLLLYLLTLAFVGYVVNGYLHQQRDRETIHRLARKIALNEAQANLKKTQQK